MLTRAIVSGFASLSVILAFSPTDSNAGLFGGPLPVCEDQKVLSKITKRFDRVQQKYHETDLQILDIAEIRETDERIVVEEETDRRFCVAKAELSDGNQPHIYYMILEGGGLASFGWNVNYCVNGYDFERAHGDKCRSVKKPF